MNTLKYAIQTQTTVTYFKQMTSQEQAILDLDALDKAYYDGSPLVPDSTYDAIRDMLNFKFPELKKKVGKKNEKSDNSVWPKVNLDGAMGSLFKCNDEKEFKKFYEKQTSGDVVVSYKADGSSIELIYQNAHLVRGASRGDGFVGDDITPNIRKFVPSTINSLSGKVRIRGEAILLKDDFQKFFSQEYKNPRNSAAGTLRRLDGQKANHLTFLAFDIEGDGYDFKTKAEKFEALKKLGFQTTLIAHVNKLEDALQIYKHVEETRSTLPYEIDVIVYEENDLELAEKAGITDNRPKASIAFKFGAEAAETTLLDVQWQVGKTGALTPVGIISPTDLGGVTISRVMLNNLDYINKLGLGIGSKATLVRANDVIPMISKKLSNGSSVVVPDSCPSCGTSLNKEDDKHIHCPNHEDCPAQTAYRITHFLSVLDVKGIGDSIVEKLMDAGVIQDIPDLFTINLDKVATVEGVSVTNVQKSYKELILKSKKVSLPKFIKSISIKNIGASATEKAMAKFPTLQSLFTAKVQDLVQIDGIGESVATDFVFGLQAKKELIEKLTKFIVITEKSSDGPLVGKVFCFTGFRSPELQEKIESLGGTISSSVTKATTHLACISTESLTTKAKKARDEGKIIISKAELEEMVNG